MEIIGSLRTGPSEAALYWDPVEHLGWLSLIEESDGSWSVVESESMLLPPPEDRWGGFSSYIQIAASNGRFIGGWVDPEADRIAATGEMGTRLAQTAPEAGGFIIFDSEAEAVQLRTFREGSLLSAVYLVPDIEPDLVPDDIPDAGWNAEFVRMLATAPEEARALVPRQLRPGLLVRSLSALLAGTPSVISAKRSAVHLAGPENEAVLFLHAYVIAGQPQVVGYDYRIR